MSVDSNVFSIMFCLWFSIGTVFYEVFKRVIMGIINVKLNLKKLNLFYSTFLKMAVAIALLGALLIRAEEALLQFADEPAVETDPVLDIQEVVKHPEGTYELFDKEGRKWIFTFVIQSPHEVIAALSREDGLFNFSFFKVEYIPETKNYRGFESESSFIDSNASVHFSIDANGRIKVNMPNAPVDLYGLSGRRVGKYTSFVRPSPTSTKKLTGTYDGYISSGLGYRIFMVLKIDEVDGKTFAILEARDKRLKIELQNVTDASNSYIYMTTAKGQRGTWFHLRLKRKRNDLEGFTVIGGMGLGGPAYFEKIGD